MMEEKESRKTLLEPKLEQENEEEYHGEEEEKVVIEKGLETEQTYTGAERRRKKSNNCESI